MTEHPILFRGEMVRAILDGRKTQTRRLVKPQPEQNGAAGGEVLREGYTPQNHDAFRYDSDKNPYFIWRSAKLDCGMCHTNREAMERLMIPLCPYGQPGDRLWVREMFLPDPPINGWLGDIEWNGCGRPISGVPVKYQRPENCIFASSWDGTALKWRPSIHMPRWACRLVLEIADVRVERLQEMSESDAKAEGAECEYDEPYESWAHLQESTGYFSPSSHLNGFERLWRTIHGGDSWNANPWLWVIEFRPIAKSSSEVAA